MAHRNHGVAVSKMLSNEKDAYVPAEKGQCYSRHFDAEGVQNAPPLVVRCLLLRQKQ